MKDTFYFRAIEQATATESQNWYLSAVAALEPNTISWVGHGEVGTTSYLYLETVLQKSDGTFDHKSLLLIAVAELTGQIGLGSSEPAYPTSLIQRSGAEWAIVVEVASSHILLIEGTSLTSRATSLFTFFETSNTESLKVVQAFAIDGKV